MALTALVGAGRRGARLGGSFLLRSSVALAPPRIQTTYMKTRAAGTYPDFFAASVREQRPDWIVVASVQTSNFGKFFGSDWDDIQAAFEDFGQGTLLDKRPGREGDPIHMMDTGTLPPIGYHRWHAAIRATQLLAERLDTRVGLAWAIQSFARPHQRDDPNPPKPKSDLQALRAAWLPMAPELRDAQFDLPSRASRISPLANGARRGGDRLAPQRGRSVLPMRNLSMACAAWRPSRMAHTTSDWPRRMSPAANTFGREVR